MENGVKLASVEYYPHKRGKILLEIDESVAKQMMDLVANDREDGEDRVVYYLSALINGNYVVEKVIFNDKTTIVFWNDHTKTVVKCQDGDTFSEEAGIALCFMKKILGNKGNYNKVLREALEKAQRQGE